MKSILFRILILCNCTLVSFAQSAKRNITPADFGKWGTLVSEVLSPDGRWLSCKMSYDSGVDTLYLINTSTLHRTKFPGATSGIFSPDSKKLAIKKPSGQLDIHNLQTCQSVSFPNVRRLEFLKNGNTAIQFNASASISGFQLLDKYNNPIITLPKATYFGISNKGVIAVASADNVQLINPNFPSQPLEIFSEYNTKPTTLTWSLSGNSLAFFSTSKDSTDMMLIHYNVVKHRKKVLYEKHLFFEGESYHFGRHAIVISENDKLVHLHAFKTIPVQVSDTLVEIWDSETFREYPEDRLYNNSENNPFLLSWNTGSGTLIKHDDSIFFNSRILPGGMHVISQLRNSIVARTDEVPPADYYITKISGKNRRLLVKQGGRSGGAIKISPSGRYVRYFRDGDHFVYDCYSHTTTNITASLGNNFLDTEYDDAGTNKGYHSPGWTHDSRYVLLYDAYDIWIVSADGSSAKRLTSGREKGTRYRLVVDKSKTAGLNFAEFSREEINLEKGVLITATTADKSTGFYTFSLSKGIATLYHSKSKADRISKVSDSYVFIEETHDRPARIMLKEDNNPAREIFQSNDHYSNYTWSSTELIDYSTPSGNSLQAILMYPANYDASRKYPMVVYIYERLTQKIYDYNNPTDAHPIGFSPTSYLLDGYLVLMPDIRYEIGNPGGSALTCVTSAVNNIIERGIVEPDHIGIVGHSFGGFEVSFIITQTPLFAAAVAGGGITDPISWYLTMNNHTGRSNAWRFESQQLRMGNSPFDNWNGYVTNSAIASAPKIITPLLNWSGKNDPVVNPEQSIELHLALRRLKKCNKLLLYPHQGHILSDMMAKRHLTKEIKNWFDFHLKY